MKKKYISVFLAGVLALGMFTTAAAGEAELFREEAAPEPDMVFTEIEGLPESDADADSLPEESIPELDTDFTETESSSEPEEVFTGDDVTRPEDVFTDNSEPEFSVFDFSNAGLLEGAQDEDKELLEDMAEGEIIGFAPMDLKAVLDVPVVAAISGDEEAAVAALRPDQYQIATGEALYCDEVWTKENHDSGKRLATTNRVIRYVDEKGVERISPLYCMNASKAGVTGVTDVKDAAIKAIQSKTLKRLLYFGYGGPGDICDTYDPTCKHIDWSNWKNRYFFTHMAISKEYANDVGKATAQEVEHVGINRFLTKITGMTVPSRSAVKLQIPNTTAANPYNANLILYRKKPSGTNYLWDSFQDGYLATRIMDVVDEGNNGNGISITRAGSEPWQLLYWKSAQDYEARGSGNPRVMAEQGALKLSGGAKMQWIFPKNTGAVQKLSFNMTLAPVSYLWVDGNVQTGQNIQDFSTFVYQGETEKVALNLTPLARGSLALSKTSSTTGGSVAGAQYTLYAAQDIYSDTVLMYREDTVIDTGTTNTQGKITFADLVPGKYYVKETKAAGGYLLDAGTYQVNIGGAQASLNVKDTPDIKGTVVIRKTDSLTGSILPDAQFTLYAWEEGRKAYASGGTVIPYSKTEQCYKTSALAYSESNKGKFKIVETEAPSGYKGSWQQEFILTSEKREFTFQAVNEPDKLATGELVITKKIREADITWAHGNPVFHFVAEGQDERGTRRKYEDYLCFAPGAYTVDADGWATLSLTIKNVPAGCYQLYEKPSLRYFLADAAAETKNVTVTRLSAPAYGRAPVDIAYATAVLSASARTAEAVFTNEKQRYDDYSHNSVVKNTVTILF